MPISIQSRGIYVKRRVYFDDRKKIDESEFILEIYRTNVKTVFILADSGMGKSKLLVSLGKRLKNSFVIFCPFRYFVDLLKKRLGTKACSKTEIKGTIVEISNCKYESEKSLIDKWLEGKCSKGT